jgi:hypothetical protein
VKKSGKKFGKKSGKKFGKKSGKNIRKKNPGKKIYILMTWRISIVLKPILY